MDKVSSPQFTPQLQTVEKQWNNRGNIMLWIIIFIILFWLIFYSLKPDIVLELDSSQVDTTRVLVASFVSSILLVSCVYIIKLILKNNK